MFSRKTARPVISRKARQLFGRPISRPATRAPLFRVLNISLKNDEYIKTTTIILAMTVAERVVLASSPSAS